MNEQSEGERITEEAEMFKLGVQDIVTYFTIKTKNSFILKQHVHVASSQVKWNTPPPSFRLLLTRCLLSVAVGLLSPRNLRVSDEWYTRFRVAWDAVPAPVQGYRLIYSPAGETRRFMNAPLLKIKGSLGFLPFEVKRICLFHNLETS